MIFPFRPIQSISNRDGRSFPPFFFLLFCVKPSLDFPRKKKRELPSWDKVELGEGFRRERERKKEGQKNLRVVPKEVVFLSFISLSPVSGLLSLELTKTFISPHFQTEPTKKSNMAAKEGAPPDHYRIFELCARADKRFDK